MDTPTLQILLAEHTRLRDLEKARQEAYNTLVQRFITTSTAAAGATLLLVEKKMLGGAPAATIQWILALLLFLGGISFFNLLGLDFALLQLTQRYQKIRAKFVELDPSLVDVLPMGLSSKEAVYNRWSSFRGITLRMFIVSGPKTTIVLLNCILAVGLACSLSWSLALWFRILIGVASAAILGVMQLSYASLRYKYLPRYLNESDFNWWI